jgi:hypothetical protein
MTSIHLSEHSNQQTGDKYVLAHVYSWQYHPLSWVIPVEQPHDRSFFHLFEENGIGKIESGFPLVLVKPSFLQGHLVSIPRSDNRISQHRPLDKINLLKPETECCADSCRSRNQNSWKIPETSPQSFITSNELRSSVDGRTCMGLNQKNRVTRTVCTKLIYGSRC